MDPEYRHRPFERSDWEGWAALWNRAYPQLPRSAAEPRDTMDRLVAGGQRSWGLGVEHRPTGQLVGMVTLASQPIDADPHAFSIGGIVDGAHRRRGIGRALWAAAERQSREFEATVVRARAAAVPAEGPSFLLRRGFVETRRSIESVIDPQTAEIGRWPDPAAEARRLGVELFDRSPGGPADRVGESELAELFDATEVDVPRSGGAARFALTDLRAWVLENPQVRPSSFWLARVDGQLVGVSYASDVPGDPHARIQQFTGTRRAYRGRGIGSLLKRQIVRAARADGIRRLSTVNDATNTPIRAANARLGYRPVTEWVHLDRPVEAGRAVSAPP